MLLVIQMRTTKKLSIEHTRNEMRRELKHVIIERNQLNTKNAMSDKKP
jgi:hypothetical protein